MSSLSVSPIHDAYGLIVGASKHAHDISARKDAERLQSVLVGELNLRAKNFLRLSLRSRAKRMATTQIDPADVRSFEARLSSMARAHDLLSHGTWEQAELRAIVEQAISPYFPAPAFNPGPSKGSRVDLPGLHELATNAAKYGALAVDQGRVSTGTNWVRVSCEMGHAMGGNRRPPGDPTNPQRFGSRLIESLLAAELNGTVKITYDPKRVVCEVDANLRSECDSSQSLIDLEVWVHFLP